MTGPSLRALGTVTSATTAAPSFAAPAGAVSTDVILVAFFMDDGRNTINSVPTGFTQAAGSPQTNDPTAGAPSHSLCVYWGRFSAVGAGPYAFGITPGTPFVEGRTAAIQGCVTTGNPFEATAGATSGNTSVATAPAVSATSTAADRYAFYAATNWSSGAWTPATGFTEQWDANTRIITFDDLALPTAQTVTPQAVCASTNRMNAWVGLLLPTGPTAISVTDTGAGAESAAVTGSAPVSDTGSAADTATAVAATPLADAGSAADATTVTASAALTDAAAGSDTLSALVSLAQADAGAALDVLVTAAAVPLADAGTAIDSLTVTTGGATLKFVTDAGSAVECVDATLIRPSAGRTSRPATGTTTRPNTGITC